MNKIFTPASALITWALLAFWGNAFSQQSPYLSFYRYNWQVVNPAAFDKAFDFNENDFIISTALRTQTVDGISWEYMPKFFYSSIEQKSDEHHVRWGLQVLGDKTDGYSTMGMYGNFSYYFRLPNSSQFIHIGVTPGILQNRLLIRNGDFRDKNESGFEDGNSAWHFDFSAGIYFRNKQKWYAGLSMPQMVSPQFIDNNKPDGVKLERTRQFFLISGAYLELSDGGLIEPSIWARYAPNEEFATITDNMPISTDLNVRYHSRYGIDDISYWVGTGISTAMKFTIEGKVSIPLDGVLYSEDDKVSLGIGYSFPFGQNQLGLGHAVELSFAYSWE
jgi:type IX secretion system PorP/SprF family membrane protein